MPTKKLLPPCGDLIFKYTAGFDRNKLNDRWSLEIDTTIDPFEFTITLVDFLESKESFVGSENIVTRAHSRFVFTDQHHLEAMLREQHKIPSEYNSYDLIALETQWYDTYSCLNIPYLRFCVNEWYLLFKPLSGDFGKKYRMLRIIG